MTKSAVSLVTCLAVLVSTVSAAPAAPKKRIEAVEILAKAEEVRSPDLDYAVDFEITVLDTNTGGKARQASYSMIAHGKDHTVILMLRPEPFYGGTLLIEKGAYWLLLPQATKPLQLAAEQVLRGDISNGDLARANLLADYEPRLDAEDALDGEACWRLELTRKADTAHFSRIRFWIAKKGYLPRKLEYYGLSGAYIKVARYTDYRKTALGLRSMKIEVDTPGDVQRTTTLVFSDLRKVDASPIRFSPEGMAAFRDVAVARKTRDAPARLEDLLAELAANKS